MTASKSRADFTPDNATEICEAKMNRRTFLLSGSMFTAVSGCQNAGENTTTAVKESNVISYDPSYLSSQRNMKSGGFQADSNGAGGYSPSKPNSVLFVSEPKKYHYQVLSDPIGGAPNKFVERFEWRNGDCLGQFDCDTYRARIEIMSDGGREGEEVWYRWSIYCPEKFQADGLGEIYGQFRSETQDLLFIEILGGTKAVKRLRGSIRVGGRQQHLKLADYEDIVGKWTEITIHTKWGENGFHNFYINRELITTYRGTTCHDSENIIFKYGIYGGQTPQQWKEFAGYPENKINYPNEIANGEFPTRVVYYSNVQKAVSQSQLRG